MQIFLELLPNGAFNLRWAVTGIQATDSSGKIEKLVASTSSITAPSARAAKIGVA